MKVSSFVSSESKVWRWTWRLLFIQVKDWRYLWKNVKIEFVDTDEVTISSFLSINNNA